MIFIMKTKKLDLHEIRSMREPLRVNQIVTQRLYI